MKRPQKAAAAAVVPPVRQASQTGWLDQLKARRLDLLALAVIAVAAWLVFHQALDYGVLNFEDSQALSRNRAVQAGITLDGLRAAFADYEFGSWYPLSWISHMVDVDIYGPEASGHHFTSLALHILNSVLLFLLLYGATGARWRSALAGVIFAIHPLHVEPVVWLSQRRELLPAAFALVALLVWRGGGRQWVVAILYVLTILANPFAAPLALVFLVVDSWWRPGAVRWKLPLALTALGAAIVAFAIWAQGRGGGIQAIALDKRLANSAASLAEYARSVYWPAGLTAYYPFPQTIPQPLVIAGVALLLLVTAAAIALRGRMPYVFAGWAWFLLFLLPMSGIIQIGTQGRADHFVYLALAGLIFASIWTAHHLLGSASGSIAVPVVAGLIVCAFAWRAWVETSYWRNDVLLFERALLLNPNNRVAHSEVGTAFLRGNRPDLAIEHLQKAIELDPKYAVGYRNLAEAMFKRGNSQRALELVDKAVALEPENGHSYFDRGKVLRDLKRLDEAYNAFDKALSIGVFKEVRVESLFQQGLIRNSQERYREAIDRFIKALELEPYYYLARKNLAFAYMRADEYVKAQYQFELLARTNPEDEDVKRSLRFIANRIK